MRTLSMVGKNSDTEQNAAGSRCSDPSHRLCFAITLPFACLNSLESRAEGRFEVESGADSRPSAVSRSDNPAAQDSDG
jgi:hypothetical protein